jgi:hypothetical protein
MWIRDPGWKKFGSGKEKKFGSGIRDEKNLDPGSVINISDPQHWYCHDLSIHIVGERKKQREIEISLSSPTFCSPVW